MWDTVKTALTLWAVQTEQLHLGRQLKAVIARELHTLELGDNRKN